MKGLDEAAQSFLAIVLAAVLKVCSMWQRIQLPDQIVRSKRAARLAAIHLFHSTHTS